MKSFKKILLLGTAILMAGCGNNGGNGDFVEQDASVPHNWGTAVTEGKPELQEGECAFEYYKCNVHHDVMKKYNARDFLLDTKCGGVNITEETRADEYTMTASADHIDVGMYLPAGVSKFQLFAEIKINEGAETKPAELQAKFIVDSSDYIWDYENKTNTDVGLTTSYQNVLIFERDATESILAEGGMPQMRLKIRTGNTQYSCKSISVVWHL